MKRMRPVTAGAAKIVPSRMDAASPTSTVAATSAAVYQFHWDTASTRRGENSTVTAAVIPASREREEAVWSALVAAVAVRAGRVGPGAGRGRGPDRKGGGEGGGGGRGRATASEQE